MSEQSQVDLLIIGGGINGAGIAADAQGRGLSVHLCEQNDLASGTSSKSTKLIHGGLRYLEHYEFRLVRESLQEREVLMRKAPHLIHPLLFVLPHHPGLRAAWLIRAGLFLYDHLAARTTLPASKTFKLQNSPYAEPLKPIYPTGFTYPDCWVDDARLVISNAIAAKEMGAKISTYCKVTELKRGPEYWEAAVINKHNHQRFVIKARAVVNATGPWTGEFLQEHAHLPSQYHIREVKGSHIVVPQLYSGEQAYILQQTDQRIVFAIPYEQHWTLIGTTEMDYAGDPANAEISPDEIKYLCDIINTYFKKSIDSTQIVWSYAGVRPLFDKHTEHKPQALSRDYTFELTDQNGQLPLLSILGGKITTYRVLAEHALDKLQAYFPQMKQPWTHQAPLPGGDMPNADFNAFKTQLRANFPHLAQTLLERLAKQYGTKCYTLLKGISKESDLGKHFGATLYQREIEYLQKHEWLYQADDLLYRRTKLALHLTQEEITNLKKYLKGLV